MRRRNRERRERLLLQYILKGGGYLPLLSIFPCVGEEEGEGLFEGPLASISRPRSHTHTQYRPSRLSPVPVTGEKLSSKKRGEDQKVLKKRGRQGLGRKPSCPSHPVQGHFFSARPHSLWRWQPQRRKVRRHQYLRLFAGSKKADGTDSGKKGRGKERITFYLKRRRPFSARSRKSEAREFFETGLSSSFLSCIFPFRSVFVPSVR